MTLLIDHATPASAGKTANLFAPGSDWRALVEEERARLKRCRDAQVQQVREQVADFILKRAQERGNATPRMLSDEARQRFGIQGVVPITEVERMLRHHGLNTGKTDGLCGHASVAGGAAAKAGQDSGEKACVPPPRVTTRRGEIVWQGWYPVGRYATFLYHVHVTVDFLDGFMTGQVFCGASPALVTEFVGRHTLPAYEKAGGCIQILETNGARAYLGPVKGRNVYGEFLQKHRIRHRVSGAEIGRQKKVLDARQALVSSFVTRWWAHLKECGRCTRRPRFDSDVSEARAKLQEMRSDLASWLRNHNEKLGAKTGN